MKKIINLLLCLLLVGTLVACSSNDNASTSNEETTTQEDDGEEFEASSACSDGVYLINKTTTYETDDETFGTGSSTDITYQYDDNGVMTSYTEVTTNDDGSSYTSVFEITHNDDGGFTSVYKDEDFDILETDVYDNHYNLVHSTIEAGEDVSLFGDNEKAYSYTYDEKGRMKERINEKSGNKSVISYNKADQPITIEGYSLNDDGEYELTGSTNYEYSDDYKTMTINYDGGAKTTYYFAFEKNNFNYNFYVYKTDWITLREVYYSPATDDFPEYTRITDYTYEGCGQTFKYEG